MNRKLKTAIVGVCAGMVALVGVFSSGVAQAYTQPNAKSHSLYGTVRCDGSTVYYTTVHEITSNYKSVSLKVTDFPVQKASRDDHGQVVYVGAVIFKRATGAVVANYAPQTFTPKSPSHVVVPGKYIVRTIFRFNARMSKGQSCQCSSVWRGSATY